ncbi:MAG TPA: type II toxin-antitoxin system VapC family toxin [Nocardioides sp.]|uniref:type II toxin-antitoxin system VapC family toxin n=1 Tax=Nocardioides sp. TaxID=35761 RepID=UPI002E309A9E|nr:type II toxin-antitoxin system VapC family toxin [Nocardioides sp.]HEX3932539.1 type II toxin-antitoxin system VapC family toxin [Nocardioides sp.]
MIVLDASAIVAALKGTDAHHQRASRILQGDRQFLAHAVTLAEVLAGGARVGRADAIRETLVGLGVAEADRVCDEAISLARLRAESRLRLPDCCALLVAQAHGAPLATFDERLAQVARARGVTVLDGAGSVDQ